MELVEVAVMVLMVKMVDQEVVEQDMVDMVEPALEVVEVEVEQTSIMVREFMVEMVDRVLQQLDIKLDQYHHKKQLVVLSVFIMDTRFIPSLRLVNSQ
jgi:hypothetical protein